MASEYANAEFLCESQNIYVAIIIFTLLTFERETDHRTLAKLLTMADAAPSLLVLFLGSVGVDLEREDEPRLFRVYACLCLCVLTQRNFKTFLLKPQRRGCEQNSVTH